MVNTRVGHDLQVLRFDEIGKDDVLIAGGKGASLGELARVGVRVPDGFVVTTDAFERARTIIDSDGKIESRISSLDGDHVGAVAEASAWIRQRVEASPLPEDLVSSVSRMYHELCASAGQGELPVAVRSSATSEDSAEASFAGLQDTYLWVRGDRAVLEAVRLCWASLYSVDSVTYRRRRNLPEAGLAMAVVVQRMVDARSSGVLFTRSPVSGDRSVVALDASWGLGSAVVGGEVTPDSYVINKITGEVVRETIADKHVRDVPAEDGKGVRSEPVPDELRNAPAVAGDEIRQLVELARKVEQHYGCPQDIEWAVSASASEGENIFVLQSRPETVWADRQRTPVDAPKEKAFHHVVSLLAGTAKPADRGKR